MSDETEATLVRMTGTAGWGFLFDNCAGTVRRGILRDDRRTLVLDIFYAGRDYSVKLLKQDGDRYAGEWERPKSAGIKGTAAATLYTSSAGELLFGEWREDGKVFHWWVELSIVDHFADQKA